MLHFKAFGCKFGKYSLNVQLQVAEKPPRQSKNLSKEEWQNDEKKAETLAKTEKQTEALSLASKARVSFADTLWKKDLKRFSLKMVWRDYDNFVI